MIRQVILFLWVTLLCFGCAVTPQPKPTFKSETRIGIVNSLEPYLTHQHVTIRRFNSFTKNIEVDWNIPGYMDAKLLDTLTNDKKRWVVVPVKSPEIQSQLLQLADQIHSATSRRRISQNLADFIENVARAYDLDVVITVQSFRGQGPWKIADSPIVIQGYGLLTRHTLLGRVGFSRHWVHPYAQFLVAAFGTRPVTILGSGRPDLITSNMDQFNWPADIKNIPQAEIEKLRPIIQQYADEAVTNALKSTRLIANAS
jgi:hypothetical protein